MANFVFTLVVIAASLIAAPTVALLSVESGAAAPAIALAPMMAWAENLRGSVEPALAGTRTLADKLRSTRPLIMVIMSLSILSCRTLGIYKVAA